jgi:SOS-response transcriptional repressor LexA
MATKKLKTLTTSARKKSSISPLTSNRSKKAASKASKSKARKKAEELKRRKELFALAHKMFGMVYEDYQAGKFHRIL